MTKVPLPPTHPNPLAHSSSFQPPPSPPSNPSTYTIPLLQTHPPIHPPTHSPSISSPPSTSAGGYPGPGTRSLHPSINRLGQPTHQPTHPPTHPPNSFTHPPNPPLQTYNSFLHLPLSVRYVKEEAEKALLFALPQEEEGEGGWVGGRRLERARLRSVHFVMVGGWVGER